MLASNRVDVSRTNATFFTSDEISGDRVVYKHDDSESRRDTFHFVATAASGGGLSSGGTSIGMATALSSFPFKTYYHGQIGGDMEEPLGNFISESTIICQMKFLNQLTRLLKVTSYK